MAHSSDIARVRKYLASDFHAIHGVHPYCMRPDRFRQLHGFSQAAARAMGMYPDSGDSIFEVPPLPYAPPPTPWTDYVPGVYRTSARFRPEAEPEGDAECCAKTLILNGCATWRQLQRLYDMLPVTVPTRACQDQAGSSPDSGSNFTVGGYSHASFHGLRRYTKSYPWTGALLASIVRSIHPAHRFTTISLINNVQSLMHADSHNDEDTCNLILPFSTFSEGGLWIENPQGSVRLDTSGPAGITHETSVPLLFEPRRKHATFPWSGRRCCLVAFHVRQAHRIPRAEMQVLLQLGFMPREVIFCPDEPPSLDACA